MASGGRPFSGGARDRAIQIKRARSAKRERMRQLLENERRKGKRWLATPDIQELLLELRMAGREGQRRASELVRVALLTGRKRI